MVVFEVRRVDEDTMDFVTVTKKLLVFVVAVVNVVVFVVVSAKVVVAVSVIVTIDDFVTVVVLRAVGSLFPRATGPATSIDILRRTTTNTPEATKR